MKCMKAWAITAMLLAGWSTLASAHYFIPVGDGSVGFYLGFIMEPAYEGESNGIEIYPFKDITRYEHGVPVDGTNVGVGDKVDVRVTVQVVETPDPAAKVLGEKRLGQLRSRYMPEQYLRKFTPYPAGMYGLKLKATINGQHFEGRVFCSPDDHSRFSCVLPRRPQPPVVFGTSASSAMTPDATR